MYNKTHTMDARCGAKLVLGHCHYIVSDCFVCQAGRDGDWHLWCLNTKCQRRFAPQKNSNHFILNLYHYLARCLFAAPMTNKYFPLADKCLPSSRKFALVIQKNEIDVYIIIFICTLHAISSTNCFPLAQNCCGGRCILHIPACQSV